MMSENNSLGEDLFSLEIPDFDFAVDAEDAAVLEVPDEEPKLSPADALPVCLNRFGRFDMSYMFQLTGKTPEEIGAVLGGSAIFQDPALISGTPNHRDGWVLREVYLSGDLREKLALAEEMHQQYPEYFEDNLVALRSSMPEVIPFGNIHLNLGAPWIPAEIVSRFTGWLLKLEPPVVRFVHQAGGFWNAEIPGAHEREYQVSYKNNVEFGTSKITAFQIIRSTLNATPVVVWKETGRKLWEGKSELVIDREETETALQRQALIMKEFSDWASGDETIRSTLADAYNTAFSRYRNTSYSGKFLTIEDMNPAFSLTDYQKDAVARILLSGSNTLLSHEVGSGKTYVIITAAHLLHKLGLSKKNMVVVPNNVLSATVALHKKLFPNDAIRMIKPSAFTPARRDAVLREIAQKGDDYSAIYIAASSFDMIGTSFDLKIKELKKELDQLDADLSTVLYVTDKQKIEAKISRLRKKLRDLKEHMAPPSWMPYDELGIQTLFVDEAHNYKNIGFAGNPAAASVSGKANNMLSCVHATPKTVMATGTLLTNSISDLYVFQTYLQPGLLQNHSIADFDAWAQTFADRETVLEVDMDSTRLTLKNRITAFVNLEELVSMFSLVSDYHENDRSALGEDGVFPEYEGPTNVSCPATDAQKAYMLELNSRVSLVRRRAVSLHEDNLLKITSDGKNAALDLRLVELPREELEKIGQNEAEFGSKIGLCAEQVWENYRANPHTAQAVFCDVGTPGGASRFNIYKDLKEKLVKKGIPEEEIAFVHDAETEQKKSELFRKINTAEIRVCIGSTQKLGVGVNIQEKLCAVHHLSIPWRPADLEQREGRILRQGNTCPSVRIYRYATQGSFDSYLYQTCENKAKFISSFLSGVTVIRSIEDLGQTVLSYSEVKRLALNAEPFIRHYTVQSELYAARLKSKMRQNEMKDLELRIYEADENIRKIGKQIEMIKADAAYFRQHIQDTDNGEEEALTRSLALALREPVPDSEREIGELCGFRAVLPEQTTRGGKTVLRLYSPLYPGHHYDTSIRTNRPESTAGEINALLSDPSARIAGLERDAAAHEKQKALAEENLAGGNVQADEVSRLEEELRQIDRELMGSET